MADRDDDEAKIDEEEEEEEFEDGFQAMLALYERLSEVQQFAIEVLTTKYVPQGERLGLDPCAHVEDEYPFGWMFPGPESFDDEAHDINELLNMQMDFYVKALAINGRDVFEEIHAGKSKGFKEFCRSTATERDHKKAYHEQRLHEFMQASHSRDPGTNKKKHDRGFDEVMDEFDKLVQHGDFTQPHDDDRAEELIQVMRKRPKVDATK